MDPKTWTLLTDDHTWMPKLARAGLIVRGPKLKFSWRFLRWMYWMKIKHLNYVNHTEG